MIVKQVTRTALAAAALALAAGAAAQAAVPANVIEHRVYAVHDDAPAAGLPSDLRIEHFVATDRDRAVITNAATGAVVSEIAKDGAVLRDWDSATNVLTTRAGLAGRNFTMSRADDAANVDQLLGIGVLTVTGTATWNGRAATVARFDGEQPGQRDATYTLDAATKQVLEIDSVEGPAFERKLLVDEDLPVTAENEAKLAIGSHPGATVVGSAAKAKASKKAKRAAKRAAARRAAARKLVRG